jgi:1-deoxyxylulose-5-phosphate synthase
VNLVERIADQRGIPMAQVAMAWLLSKREVTSPIVGATKISHLTDAIAALDVTLGADEIAALEAPYTAKNPVF